MRVFVPMDISSHPYLRLLYSNLRDAGVKCYDLKKITDILNVFRADIIHFHWIEFFLRSSKGFLFTLLKFSSYLFFCLLAKFLKKRIVITLHNIKPHEPIYPILEHFGFLFSLRIADAIIVHNEWSKEEASRIYKIEERKIHVIPHGNFIGYYPNEISKVDARNKLKIPKEAFVILYFGKIRKYKGLNILISTLKGIKESDIWVVICGKPEDEEIKDDLLKFGKTFKNCILRLNYIPDSEIQVYMNACDVGVLPYEEITTSGTLLLFASFKRTVIVPNLKSIKEVVGEAAIYYTPGDVDDLKRAIIESKNKNLGKMSKMIFKKALKYNWKNIATKTYQLYQKVRK